MKIFIQGELAHLNKSDSVQRLILRREENMKLSERFHVDVLFTVSGFRYREELFFQVTE